MRIRKSLPVAPIAVALIVVAGPAWAALDPTFSGDGRQTTNFTPGYDTASDVAIQADGRIVAVGEAAGGRGRFAVARYATDGSLDPTFGGGDGKVVTDFTPYLDAAFAVAIQADGKIVVVGEAAGRYTPGGVRVSRLGIARYATDGTLDPTFGGDGRVTTNLSPGQDFATDVEIHEGRVLAVGTADFGCFCSRFAFVRYLGDGSLDATFSGDGIRRVRFRFGAEAEAAEVRANGKIVAAGSQPDAASFAVARLLSNGSSDATFGGDGKVVTHAGRGEEGATGVTIQPDGRIVVAGFTDQPHEHGDRFGPGRFALIRYLVDGELDPSFGGDGIVKTRFGDRFAHAQDVARQADGRLVAVGVTGGRGGRFAAARYAADGSLDPTFGGDGRVTVNFTSGFDLATGVDVEADGDLVLAGSVSGRGGRFGLCRLLT
jgi:uncharacterized delta-60 repeat protein